MQFQLHALFPIASECTILPSLLSKLAEAACPLPYTPPNPVSAPA